ncbi:MAG: sigma-70 family RNA polymerase sigma factor [Archangium sp.]|nr:sigma-70 family RNA polymerase sigma factor [Archangium sp.]MDP3155446.1 sigma-70 family RNA polymerase sigma factor [Archangium sp.]MDP3573778.1 sigma-70 family RNA polymerase sigma factor [Archangium sp.]
MGPPTSGGLTRDEVQRLYAQFAPVVFRRARVLLARDADAWDVVQEVFERMLTHGAAFRGESRPMTWVYRVTTNVALNQIRSRKLREPLLTVVPIEPSTSVDDVEARQLLTRWLAHLDDREIEVASLLFIDGLTQQEVADVLGLSRKTIVREVEELRQKLEALGALPEGVES